MTALTLEMPARVRIALQSVADAKDRSLEWVAMDILQKWAADHIEASYEILAALEAEALKLPKIQPSQERAKLSHALRLSVFARDAFKCVYCGSKEELHCDHIVPVVDGGKTKIANLQTLCAKCNLGKSDNPCPLTAEDPPGTRP